MKLLGGGFNQTLSIYVLITEIKTVDGGQKDAVLRRASIKKILFLAYTSATLCHVRNAVHIQKSGPPGIQIKVL